jgi:drug/metabolite transporter (DMT)-like permease
MVMLPRDRHRVLPGVVISGLIGAVVLIGPWGGLGHGSTSGHLSCAVATTSTGLGLTYVRRHLSEASHDGIALTAVQLLLGTAQMLSASAIVGWGSGPASATPQLGALLALGIVGTGGAYVLSYELVRRAGAVTASTIMYLLPVISTGLGLALLHERLLAHQVAGAVIILSALAWSQRGSRLAST